MHACVGVCVGSEGMCMIERMQQGAASAQLQ